MRKGFVKELIDLGEELSKEREAAHDVWTWLPSYKVAEKHHGDYASEHCPNPRDVMVEAAMYIAMLKAPPGQELSLEDKEWFERCPCGEDHIPDE